MPAGGRGVLDPDPAQGPVAGVHGGLGELGGVHLAQALVALQRLLPALAAPLELQQRPAAAPRRSRCSGTSCLALARCWSARSGAAAGPRRRPGPRPASAAGTGGTASAAGYRMCAPSTSASVIRMTCWYRAASRSNESARAGPDHLDDRGALGVLEHVGQRGLLHVEDLAADRQQRLELRVPGQLGGAERGVALDDEQLAAVVGRRGSPPAWPAATRLASADLATLVVAVLPGGDRAPWRRRPPSRAPRGPAACRRAAGSRSSAPQLARSPPARRSGGGRGAEHLLGLALELRLGQPDRDDRGEALEHVVLDDGLVAVLQQPGRAAAAR